MKARIYANHPEAVFDWLLSLERVSSNNWVEVDISPERHRRWAWVIKEYETVQAEMLLALAAMDVDPRDLNLGNVPAATMPQEDLP